MFFIYNIWIKFQIIWDEIFRHIYNSSADYPIQKLIKYSETEFIQLSSQILHIFVKWITWIIKELETINWRIDFRNDIRWPQFQENSNKTLGNVDSQHMNKKKYGILKSFIQTNQFLCAIVYYIQEGYRYRISM